MGCRRGSIQSLRGYSMAFPAPGGTPPYFPHESQRKTSFSLGSGCIAVLGTVIATPPQFQQNKGTSEISPLPVTKRPPPMVARWDTSTTSMGSRTMRLRSAISSFYSKNAPLRAFVLGYQAGPDCGSVPSHPPPAFTMPETPAARGPLGLRPRTSAVTRSDLPHLIGKVTVRF